MNSFIAYTCLLAVAAGVHGSGLGGLGYGGYELSAPIIYSAPVVAPAVSSVNVYKAAPIPVIKKVVAPIISAPIIAPAPIISAPIVKVPVVNYDLGLGKGLDYLNLGIGLNKLSYGGLGYGGLGYGGLGYGGLGYGLKH